jgi:hypothetical protein
VAFPAQVPVVSAYLVEVVSALTVGAELAPVGNPVTTEIAGALEFVGAEATAWLLTVKRVTDVEIAAFIAETLSVRNLGLGAAPNCAVVGVKVIAVAPVIEVQPVGVVETTEVTRLGQLNLW